MATSRNCSLFAKRAVQTYNSDQTTHHNQTPSVAAKSDKVSSGGSLVTKTLTFTLDEVTVSQSGRYIQALVFTCAGNFPATKSSNLLLDVLLHKHTSVVYHSYVCTLTSALLLVEDNNLSALAKM
jgi:hypothetical protein